MEESRLSRDDEPTAVYEIRLQGDSAALLREHYPTATVLTTGTETVLFRRVEKPGELDDLITQLFSVGLVLTEVQEVPLRSSPAPAPENQKETS